MLCKAYLVLDPAYDTTFIEAPETPAHQFAVKAFKRAMFGTPGEEVNNPPKKLEKKAKIDAVNSMAPDMPVPKDNTPPTSPSKQPGGILMTPGTTNKGRKTVSFDAHVVNNEGKGGKMGRSGIPNDCPGKFPSPWTPGIELKTDLASDKKPRTKLTEALLDARTTTQPKFGQKLKARDDSDITIDLGAPRSESGKYWKGQYENYAERSEREMKKLVAKQQLAKNYAKKKDGEMTELATRLEQERKRFRQRERELEQQNKDFQERLRQAMGEKMAAGVEIAALKSRIEALERSIVAPSSEVQNNKTSFQIFEDTSKDGTGLHPDPQKGIEESSILLPTSSPFPGKENSPPKPRHIRRQTLSDMPPRPSPLRTTTSTVDTEVNQPPVILAKSPRAFAGAAEVPVKSNLASFKSEQPSKSQLSIREFDMSKENVLPKSPAAILPSSPLPQPSPDPWVNLHESSIPQIDKMAMPIASGTSYSRPTRPAQSSRHRVSKSVSQFTKTDTIRTAGQNQLLSLKEPELEAHKFSGRNTANYTSTDTRSKAGLVEKPVPKEPRLDATSAPKLPTGKPSTDPKFDIAKITSHHAEGSSQVKRDRSGMLDVDRRENATRRLLERKQKKLIAS